MHLQPDVEIQPQPCIQLTVERETASPPFFFMMCLFTSFTYFRFKKIIKDDNVVP